MFDNFRDSQFVAYSILKNSILSGKLSHAYLIDGNNYEYAFDFVMAFVKMIICNNNYSNNLNCNNCNICRRIDDGNYTEVKIISSDSLVIKKEQVLELQKDFSLSGIEDSKRVYIIKDCDKMNKQASNCLLKFLEEPTDGIIAILFTNNISNVLSTVSSRCQLIKLINKKRDFCNNSLINFAYSFCSNKDGIDSFISDDNKKNLLVNVINFLDYYEKNDLDTMIYLKKLWYNSFQTRDDSILSMYLVVVFYYDCLKYIYGIDNYFFNDNLDLIKYVVSKNSNLCILKKVELAISKYNDLKYNLNVNLLIDDFVIRLGECNECS